MFKRGDELKLRTATSGMIVVLVQALLGKACLSERGQAQREEEDSAQRR
jgi:hypothetical protein